MTVQLDPNIQDRMLLEKIKAGDERAFELVFKNYYPHLVLLAQKYLGDKDLSESIVQGVFVKMWEKRRETDIKSLKGFLVVAVRNKCTNELKHRQVVYQYEKNQTEKPEPVWMSFNENVYLNKINSVIDELPEQRRRIFKMSRMDGLKYKEIAEKLNISPKTVEVQMGKALKYLREQLQTLKKQMLATLLLLLML
ncbi:RNA polymerase sigma-70 factor [Carboxylicivirga sediminis]|uniref:RNA polymerase sigma-70 factor n=1 Tax=Carboxylicivirga sediminis TaxID=2006564 RepID=A0A941F5L2_9BACT|nr:RNA polymerase sigma-70 factor [Carboxylicivirga sediminis]MBR8535655.1 RNA polymerase sigma-70 factor [Carboxylicivirga sediminis]